MKLYSFNTNLVRIIIIIIIINSNILYINIYEKILFVYFNNNYLENHLLLLRTPHHFHDIRCVFAYSAPRNR